MIGRLRDRALATVWRLRYRDIWHRVKVNRILRMSDEDKRSRGISRTVRLLGNFPGLWHRTIEQTPNGDCQWGSTLFVAAGSADHYVILNSIYARDGTPLYPDLVLPERTRVWGLHMEPEGYIRLLNYDVSADINHVSRFYTNSNSLLQSGGIYRPSPPYVHFISGKSWNFLSSVGEPEKKHAVGIIVSDVGDLEGHITRQRFLEQISSSGIDCLIWGRGESLRRFPQYRGFVLNKWDVHSICRYSIVIENTRSQYYWSEKVADALLGYSVPLYYGCTNLASYLPARSFIPIDINAPDCVRDIKAILASDLFSARQSSVRAARRVLLDKENLYAFLDRELRVEGLVS